MGRRERRELGRKEEKEGKYTILRNILRSLRGKEAEGKQIVNTRTRFSVTNSPLLKVLLVATLFGFQER